MVVKKSDRSGAGSGLFVLHVKSRPTVTAGTGYLWKQEGPRPMAPLSLPRSCHNPQGSQNAQGRGDMARPALAHNPAS